MDDFIKPEFLTYMVLLDPKLIVSLLVKGFSSMTPTVVEKTENYLWW
jgi:hypothetical protein